MVEYVRELAALTAYAKMMNTLETDCLEPILADDLRYNSQWVFCEMIGKDEYLDFMKGKFEKIAGSGSRPYTEIGELSDYPCGYCVVMAQGNPDNLIATVLIRVRDGLVSHIDMCAVPDPRSVRRTGDYPGGNS
jgi:hypothetical protein